MNQSQGFDFFIFKISVYLSLSMASAEGVVPSTKKPRKKRLLLVADVGTQTDAMPGLAVSGEDVLVDAMAKLEPFIKSPRKKRSDAGMKRGPRKTCCICLDFLTKALAFFDSKCNHTAHQDCMDKWIREGKNSCPVCRSNLDTGSPAPPPDKESE